MSAESEAVGQGHVDLLLPGRVRDEVKITAFIGIVEIHGRRQNTRFDGLCTGDEFHTAAGAAVQNLTNTAGEDKNPAWSADGCHIVWDSDRDGDFEIYVMDIDGSNVTALTNNTSTDRAPHWKPAPLS